MQVKQRHNNVRQGGFSGGTSNFGIAINAKMFKTLSDSLYQDKPGSIVREIVCNAVDAHILAGKADVPVVVHLPNAIEPWFSVRDEGVGLSDEAIRGRLVPVMEINDDGVQVPVLDDDGQPLMVYRGGTYNTFGESPKDQSNDQIGAYGLGSKTPFAYTDQFTVASIHGGMKRIYIAVIGNDGMPRITLQSESETDEHAGMEISLSINKDDFGAFTRAVSEQLRFLPVRPTLVNNLDGMTFPDLDKNVKFRNDLVTVYETKSYADRAPINELWVTQGGVGYPLSLHNLGTMPDAATEFANALMKMGAIIDFPIGEIEVTASREGISYEETTIQNIIKRLSMVASSLCEDALNKIRAESLEWNRAVIFNAQINVVQRALRSTPSFDKLFTLYAAPNTNNSYTGDMVLNTDKLSDASFVAVMMRKYSVRRRDGRDTGVRVRRCVVTGSNMYKYGAADHSDWFSPSDDYHVFVRDTKKKPIARINKFCEENNYPPVVVIENGTLTDQTFSDNELQNVADCLGIDVGRIKRLSSLPAPVSKGGGRSGSRPRAFQYDASNKQHTRGNSMHWEPLYDKVDDLDPGVYLPMDRHDVEWGADVDMLINCVREGVLDHPIYAVNMQTAGRIKEGKIGAQLITATQAIDAIRDQIAAAHSLHKAYMLYSGFLGGLQDELLNGMDEHGLYLPLLEKVKSVRKRKAILEKRAAKFRFTWTRDADVIAMYQKGEARGEERMKAFYARYPMLKHVRNTYQTNSQKIQDCIDYVKLVERGA